MEDDADKIINLKTHRRDKRSKVDNEIMGSTYHSLWDLWRSYADKVSKHKVPNELCLSDKPSAVFSVLLEQLVSLALASGLDKEEVLDSMLELAIIEGEPKGRLYVLLNKASNLIQYDDEDAWERMVRTMHAAGKLTDEELARELKVPE